MTNAIAKPGLKPPAAGAATVGAVPAAGQLQVQSVPACEVTQEATTVPGELGVQARVDEAYVKYLARKLCPIWSS